MLKTLGKVYRFYRDGFSSMTIGRSLWLLIIIKVAILFLVLKLFFFPNTLEEQSSSEGVSCREVVRTNLLERNHTN